MAILAFATGGSTTANGTPPSDLGTTTASRIAPDAREGLGVNEGLRNTYQMNFDEITGDYWLSFYWYADDASWVSSGTEAVIEVRDGAQESLRLTGAGDELCDLSWWNGAGFTTIASNIPMTDNTLYRVDIQYVRAVSGAIRLYINGTLNVEDLRDTTGNTLDPDNVLFGTPGGPAVADATYFSSMFIADEDTRAITMVQNTLTGDGGTTDMTGTYTDVNDFGLLEDTNKITSGAANQVQLMTKSALPAPYNTGYDIVGLGVYARAAVGISGSANMEFVQDDTVNQVTSGDIALDEFLSPKTHVFTTAPDGGAWDVTKLDAAEIGVKSKA